MLERLLISCKRAGIRKFIIQATAERRDEVESALGSFTGDPEVVLVENLDDSALRASGVDVGAGAVAEQVVELPAAVIGDDDAIGPQRRSLARILDIEVLDESFERPVQFDLAAYWKETTERLEAELHPNVATVRLSPPGLKMLAAFSSPYVRTRLVIENETDVQGWREARLPVGSVRQAAVEFLRLGAEVEVLEPEALRAKMAEMAAALRRLYPV